MCSDLRRGCWAVHEPNLRAIDPGHSFEFGGARQIQVGRRVGNSCRSGPTFPTRMIWELFAKWPDLAASVIALVLGAFLISLGILFVMARILIGSSLVQVPWAVGMVVVGAALMALVGFLSRPPPETRRVPTTKAE